MEWALNIPQPSANPYEACLPIKFGCKSSEPAVERQRFVGIQCFQLHGEALRLALLKKLELSILIGGGRCGPRSLTVELVLGKLYQVLP